MSAWVETMLSNAIVATLLAMLIGVVAVFRPRPVVIHALWLIVLLKLLTPPLIRFELLSDQIRSSHRTTMSSDSFDGFVIDSADSVGSPLAREVGPVGSVSVESEDRISGHANGLLSRRSDWLPAALGAIWAAGSVAWFVFAGARLLRFRRELGRTRPASEALQRIADEVAGRLGLRARPMVRLCDANLPPLLTTFGWHGLVLLPRQLVRDLSPPQQAAIIAHELAHFRRGDHWVRWLEFVVVGLYWWHPVVWLAQRQLQQAEESCCDAWVLRVFPDQARSYAQALMTTVDFLSEVRTPVPSGASGFGRVHFLQRRLEMILKRTWRPDMSSAARVTLIAVALGVLPWTPRAFSESESRPADPTSSTPTATNDGQAKPSNVVKVEEENIKQLSATEAEPEGGKQVNGLKLTLTADKIETVMKAEGSNAEPVKLKLTFTNVGDKPIKLDAYDIFGYYAKLTITGPDAQSVHVVHTKAHRTGVKDATEADYPTLQTSNQHVLAERPSFPGVIAFPNSNLAHYSFLKPGDYRIRVSYEKPEKDVWAKLPLAAGAWTGALTSNELVLTVKAAGHPKLGIIRLGETKDQIVTRYGEPKKTETLASGIESLSFQHGGIRLLVEISPKSKQVIQIFYFKGTPFTGTQIGELLERNAEGSKWRPNPTTEGGYRFERFDGGTMRSGKASDDEYMLAFLSGSEFRGRNAEADAAREREIKDSLTEIDGAQPPLPAVATPAAKEDAPKPTDLEALLKAKDFWAKTGAKMDHPELTGDDRRALRKLVGAADLVVRIRASKLMLDIDRVTKVDKNLKQEEAEEALVAAFTYLEANINKPADKFRPQLGITHAGVGRNSDDADGVWILVEDTRSVDVPSSGINILWNPKKKVVDKVDYWGLDRSR